MLPLIELLDYLPGEEGCVKIVMKALFLGAVLYVLWFVTKDNPPLGIALTVTVLLLMAVARRYRKRIRLIEADRSAPPGSVRKAARWALLQAAAVILLFFGMRSLLETLL